jgi:hypothetical protein
MSNPKVTLLIISLKDSFGVLHPIVKLINVGNLTKIRENFFFFWSPVCFAADKCTFVKMGLKYRQPIFSLANQSRCLSERF